MKGLFSGLEKFGLQLEDDITVFDEEKKKVKNEAGESVAVELREEDLLIDRIVKCPICEKKFKTKSVKSGKIKALESDKDLRPRYKELDVNKYGVKLCTNCGYAALDKFFVALPPAQEKLVKEQISSKFDASDYDKECDIYSYDMAIERYKLALLNSIVKKARVSERAYTCLKTAWVIRGKSENLSKDSSNYEELKAQLRKEEDAFLKNALEGFYKAASTEGFPMCGMDESMVDYIIAVLAMRFKKYDLASRVLSNLLISKNTNRRIKDRAYDLKEELITMMKVDKSK